jgi:hypothetical protein
MKNFLHILKMVIIYVVIGAILAGPYTDLASGTAMHFLLTILFIPLGLVLIVVVSMQFIQELRSRSGFASDGAMILLGVVCHVFFPVLMNIGSGLITSTEHEWLQYLLFHYRYVGFVVVTVFVACSIGVAVLQSFRSTARSHRRRILSNVP